MNTILLILLIGVVGAAVHRCPICADPEAIEAERINRDEHIIKILFEDSWDNCTSEASRRHFVADDDGCVRIKVFDHSIPNGLYHLILAPLSSLVTINGQYLREDREEMVLYIKGTRGEIFELTYCYRLMCFNSEPTRYWGDRFFYPPEKEIHTDSSRTTTAPLQPRFSLAQYLGSAAVFAISILVIVVVVMIISYKKYRKAGDGKTLLTR